MKVIYKATKQDINMPIDKELQQRIIKYSCWGLGLFTFWATLGINFLFWFVG